MRSAKTGLIPVGIPPEVRLVFNEKKDILGQYLLQGGHS